jgi:hypothetical protein
MAKRLVYEMSVRTVEGPSGFVSSDLEVEAYTVHNLVVEAGNGAPNKDNFKISAGDMSKVQLVFITASSYEKPLELEVDGGQTVILNQAVLLVGDATKLIGNKLDTISLTNSAPEAVTVDILIGRDVSAP